MKKELSTELRAEKPQDYRETEEVVREAFWNHYAPGCIEHYLLHTMRDHSDFVPELDLVAIHDDTVVGMVAYSKTSVQDDSGKTYAVLGLGPIAVLPKYQGCGIGGKLIAHTQALAHDKGERAIFLLGDPDYYSQYGFVPAEQFGIRTADNKYADALQVYPLYKDALAGITGRYIEGAIYEVDEETAAKFDKEFPTKELISGTSSQKRFEELVTAQREADV